jgi:hypothetical protein
MSRGEAGKENTNRSIHEKKESTGISQSKGESFHEAKSTHSTAVDLPLFTERLKPMKQKTKHGTVEILEDGQLCLDFTDEKYLMKVTSNGQQVRQQIVFYLLQIQLFNREENIHSAAPVKSYLKDSLSGSLAKRFKYACKFVDLIRSKTPKVSMFCISS